MRKLGVLLIAVAIVSGFILMIHHDAEHRETLTRRIGFGFNDNDQRIYENDLASYDSTSSLLKWVAGLSAIAGIALILLGRKSVQANNHYPVYVPPLDLPPAIDRLKKCPMCAEDIREAAVVCKHCGHQMAATSP